MRSATCHPERKHYAHGLCSVCYHKALSAAHPERRRIYEESHREVRREQCRIYRTTHRDECIVRHRQAYWANAEDARARARAYYAAHREECRARNRTYCATHKKDLLAKCRQRNYGVKPSDVETMLAAQREVCAICGYPFPATPEVDHNHMTGALRGLLCRECNLLLGIVERENRPCLDWPVRAKAYLEKHAVTAWNGSQIKR